MRLRAHVRALQKHLATTSTDDDVRAISELMDELGAAAAGGPQDKTQSLSELIESSPIDTEKYPDAF